MPGSSTTTIDLSNIVKILYSTNYHFWFSIGVLIEETIITISLMSSKIAL